MTNVHNSSFLDSVSASFQYVSFFFRIFPVTLFPTSFGLSLLLCVCVLNCHTCLTILEYFVLCRWPHQLNYLVFIKSRIGFASNFLFILVSEFCPSLWHFSSPEIIPLSRRNLTLLSKTWNPCVASVSISLFVYWFYVLMRNKYLSPELTQKHLQSECKKEFRSLGFSVPVYVRGSKNQASMVNSH